MDSAAFTAQKDANGTQSGLFSYTVETLFPYLWHFLPTVAQQREKEEATEKRRFDRQKRNNLSLFFILRL